MARTSPDIVVKEFYKIQSDSNPVMFAADMAELIKRMIEQGKLEIKDGQIVPKGNA